MDTVITCTDYDGTVCDSCNYLVDRFTEVPWGIETAKVCLECYLKHSE